MKTKNIIVYSLFTAFICIFSCIAIPIGPVPVTLSIMAVIITALVLGAKGGVVAALLYILLGSFGLPVFSGFAGGVQALFGPNGGYIWSYLIVAFLTGMSKSLVRKSGYAGYTFRVLIALLSVLICYLLGTLWFVLMQNISFAQALVICVYPFIAFDIVKVIIAVYIADTVNKRISFIN